MLIRVAVGLALIFGLTGCASTDWGQVFKGTLAGVAENACRSSSSCSTGMRRDALAPKPAWDTGGASPKDTPMRLPPPK